MSCLSDTYPVAMAGLGAFFAAFLITGLALIEWYWSRRRNGSKDPAP